MKKIHIVVLVIFGFIMTPTISYACGIKSEKKCCKKEASTKQSDQKECCDKSSGSGDKKGCGGKCGNPSCNCPVMVNFSLPAVPITYLESYTLIIASEKKVFHYTEIYISSAFARLRLPPKIS